MDDDDSDAEFVEAVRRREAEAEALKPKPIRVVAGGNGDPALRLALINAGVITYADLARAEEELRAAREGGQALISRQHPANRFGSADDRSSSSTHS